MPPLKYGFAGLLRPVGSLRRLTRAQTLPFQAVVLFFMFGCARDISGARDITSKGADTLAITPEVAKSLTPSGQFVLAGPSNDPMVELSENQAQTIGRIWIRQFFPWVHRELDKEHGSTINQATLRVCPRIYYADSPYEPVLDIHDAGIARRTFGPWWLVPLCVEGRPQVLLGISAYATGVRIENDAIRLPKFSGNEFTWRGIPQSVTEFPASPEAAVGLVASESGARIAAIPRLQMPDFREGGPEAARWQLALNAHVGFETVGSHRRVQASSVFFGPGTPGDFNGVLLQPKLNQPDQVEIQIIDWGTKNGYRTVILRRKDGVSLDLEPAKVRRQ